MISTIMRKPVFINQAVQPQKMAEASNFGFRKYNNNPNFQTDRSGRIVQIQIRLLLYSLIRVFTVSNPLICIFLSKYPKVWTLCLNFRLIIAKFSGFRKFRNFTVERLY